MIQLRPRRGQIDTSLQISRFSELSTWMKPWFGFREIHSLNSSARFVANFLQARRICIVTKQFTQKQTNMFVPCVLKHLQGLIT